MNRYESYLTEPIHRKGDSFGTVHSQAQNIVAHFCPTCPLNPDGKSTQDVPLGEKLSPLDQAGSGAVCVGFDNMYGSRKIIYLSDNPVSIPEIRKNASCISSVDE